MSYVIKSIRLLVPANKAKPSPQIGQALGSIGINMMKFCKEFNAKTTAWKDELPLRVRLKAFNDGNYNFTVHAPQTSYLLKKCAGIELGSGKPGHDIVGTVHVKQIYEIAKLKSTDGDELLLTPLPAIFRTILHSCKSIGLAADFSKEDELIEKRAAAKIAADLAATKVPTGKIKKKSGGKK